MNLAHYLLQANIYLILFYGFYRLLLDRETYFVLNRIYLLSAACFSLLIPFIHVDWFTGQPVSQNISVTVSELYTVAGLSNSPAQTPTWGIIIALIYVVVTTGFLLRFLVQLASVSRLMRNIPEGTAFSFFKRVAIHHQLPDRDVINAHEQTHMRQMHSVDILFFELLTAFTWFNPIIYMYKRSIRNVHEYLADERAAKFQGNKEQYSLLLLSKAFGVNPNTLTNSFFNHSLIKKRIAMLHKEKSKRTAILKYGLFLPLFALTLILSSAILRKNETIKEAAENIPLEQPLTVVKEALPNAMFKGPVPKASLKTKDKKAVKSSSVNQLVSTGTQVEESNEIPVQEKVYDFVAVDTPPTYPGGIAQFYAYLGKTIKYPEEALKNKTQGKVFVEFIVEKDGTLSNIKVDKSLSPETDAEALRVLNACSAWNPGLKDKQPVRVMFHIPVSFSLGGPAKAAPIDAKKMATLPTTAMYLIDGQESTAAAVEKLDPKNIASMNVIKASDVKQAADAPIARDVIVIKTKSAPAAATAK